MHRLLLERDSIVEGGKDERENAIINSILPPTP